MKLVSVVSPCYNSEKYLHRFLDSIISQTYRPIELILVNDGSTDGTDIVITNYRDKLLTSGIILKYIIKKQNEGIGAAINDGLKQATGSYLIWPDTDDFLYPQSIEKRVNFLEENSDYGIVTSDGYEFIESDLDNPKEYIKAIVPKNGNIFFNVVSGNIVYTPCGYMIKMDAFKLVNPNKEIFPSKYGQNIQMLMPVSYRYLCGHIQEPLYGRVDMVNSLSKRVWNETNDAWKKRILGLSDIYTETLKSIGGEALSFIPYIKYRDLRILLSISKKINNDERKKQKNILFKSTRLLIVEIIRGLINIIIR